MPAIHLLDGPLRLDPGIAGESATFAFVNVSPWPICDLRITTWDSDWYGSTPEILPNRGFGITTFDPRPLPNNRIGVDNEQDMAANKYNRSDDDEETDETYVTFKSGNCIQPGKGFCLNLKFDEPLDGNEGIDISPSRTVNGEHYSIGSDVVERPGPSTWSDLLEALGKIGAALPIGALLGAVQNDATAEHHTSMAMAATRGVLRPAYQATAPQRALRLPIEALASIDEVQYTALHHLGIKTINDLIKHPVFVDAQLLAQVGRRLKHR
jgi:hypothetical protein